MARASRSRVCASSMELQGRVISSSRESMATWDA
jgi:hypothetical protein